MNNETRIERESDRELVLTRQINGPPRLVFEAWTRPELFARWWVPKSMPITLVSCDMDVRVGGGYRLVFAFDGQTADFFGRYVEVTPPSRLVWTNEEGGEVFTTIVTFEPRGAQTLVTMRELYPTKAALDAAIASGATAGNPETMDQLDAFVTGMHTQPTDVARLYLMQVGAMPEYDIPIVCYLVQTRDGKNILIDSGLPEVLPDDAAEFKNGRGVQEHLADLGLRPRDIHIVISTHYDGDHAGRHALFTDARYVVQRAHHADAATNKRYAAIRPQWDQPMTRIDLVDGDTELLPGLRLIETGGHVPGHQSVLLQLPHTGAILLAIDAVPFAAGFARDAQQDGDNPDAAAMRASTLKLLDLVAREHIPLVIFGHDQGQWNTLKQAPAFYE